MSKLSASDFSKLAAALMAQMRGEPVPEGVDLTDRKQLLAFAETIVAGDGESSEEEEEPVPPLTTAVEEDEEESDESTDEQPHQS